MPRDIHAVVLAAGLGVRLRNVSGGLPKALVPVGGMTILSRSLATLRGSGIPQATVVVGYEGERVREAARALWPGVGIVENDVPERTGSMRSLALAWEWMVPKPDSVLVVEGDLLYGPDALEALLRADGADLVLLSNPTGAGDEVWVRGEGDRIGEISKHPSPRGTLLGELVGLSLLSAETLDAMVSSHRSAGAEAEGEHYEERIALVSQTRVVRGLLVEGLAWAEVDDASQLQRAEELILPHLDGRAGGQR